MEIEINLGKMVQNIGLDDTVNIYNEILRDCECTDMGVIFFEHELAELWSNEVYDFITRHIPQCTKYFVFDGYDHVTFMDDMDCYFYLSDYINNIVNGYEDEFKTILDNYGYTLQDCI